MRLPTIRDHSALEGFADIPLENVNEDQEANFDVPQSLEEKADSYPNGPIRIYESGIDLYYEPSLEVACQYDVILNVASEVKNPFTSFEEVPQNVTVFQTSPTVGVLADPTQDSSSPSTPKATPISTTADTVNEPLPTKQPEYIHIPWEHNTDIVPDLYRLVKLIDERVSQGKRVLVHCQCGVSRSASLIVAYGLYKNPGTTVQEAYDAVKRRSKWIGPNMNLIMQLQEFRSSLLRSVRREHGYSSQLFTLPRKLSTAVSSASTTDHFTAETESGPVTPRTAPLPPENTSPIIRASAGNMGPFSAGPVEPAQGSFWEPGFRRSWGSNSTTDLTLQAVSVSDTPYVDAKGHLVPIVTVMEQEQSHLSLSSEAHTYSPSQLSLERSKSLKRKTINFSKPLSLKQDLEDAHSPIQDAGVLFPSPRSEEFHMSPFGTDDTLIEKHDASGIFSPLNSSFAQNPFDRLKKTPEHSPSGLSIHEQILRLPSFQSSTSPLQQSKPIFRNDPLEPAVPPTTPPNNRSVRTKFSSPSMREQIHLQRLQTQIEASLPHSPGSQHSLDDIDALMSPRATEFTINPFHALLSPSLNTPQRQLEPKVAVTPTSSASDPRSPAQHGISPITRNILDVL
jgi:tyrosine-protein phosphatase